VVSTRGIRTPGWFGTSRHFVAPTRAATNDGMEIEGDARKANSEEGKRNCHILILNPDSVLNGDKLKEIEMRIVIHCKPHHLQGCFWDIANNLGRGFSVMMVLTISRSHSGLGACTERMAHCYFESMALCQ
jgi:hypothetical protein